MLKIFLLSSFFFFNLAVAEGLMRFSLAPDSEGNQFKEQYFYTDEWFKRFVRFHNISSVLVIFSSNETFIFLRQLSNVLNIGWGEWYHRSDPNHIWM